MASAWSIGTRTNMDGIRSNQSTCSLHATHHPQSWYLRLPLHTTVHHPRMGFQIVQRVQPQSRYLGHPLHTTVHHPRAGFQQLQRVQPQSRYLRCPLYTTVHPCQSGRAPLSPLMRRTSRYRLKDLRQLVHCHLWRLRHFPRNLHLHTTMDSLGLRVAGVRWCWFPSLAVRPSCRHQRPQNTQQTCHCHLHLLPITQRQSCKRS